jgi:hypothetical protein
MIGKGITRGGPTAEPQAQVARRPPGALHVSLWPHQPSYVAHLLLYNLICPRKKTREDFWDEAPPSRDGTWAGAILLSGGAIPPGKLPS